MPIKRSNFSGSGNKRYKRPIPLVNPAKKMDPGSALTASIAAISQVVDQLNKILKGPMAPASQFMREYVIIAAKNLTDLLQQLSIKLGGASQLDAVAVAATELLDIAADIGEDEVAANLAEALQMYATANDDPQIVSLLLSEASNAQLSNQRITCTGTTMHITADLKVDCDGIPVKVRIDSDLPLQSLDHQVEEIG
jgi:hypothetical protein